MNKNEFPNRPPRLMRVFQGMDLFYFVTFNTHNRLPILANDQVHNAFCNFGEEANRRNVAIGRYVIMPDHIHLFVKMPPEGITLAKWVQALKSVLGKTILAIGHPKPHWQEGFFDHLLRSGESYGQKWEYVRQNPARKGLIEPGGNWPYQGELCVIPWL
jgi:putative transposase